MASAAGSLPSRCLVASSQADAALISLSFASHQPCNLLVVAGDDDLLPRLNLGKLNAPAAWAVHDRAGLSKRAAEAYT